MKADNENDKLLGGMSPFGAMLFEALKPPGFEEWKAKQDVTNPETFEQLDKPL